MYTYLFTLKLSIINYLNTFSFSIKETPNCKPKFYKMAKSFIPFNARTIVFNFCLELGVKRISNLTTRGIIRRKNEIRELRDETRQRLSSRDS